MDSASWGIYFADLVEGVEEEGLALVDGRKYVRTWNRGLEKIVGLSQAEVLERPLEDTGLTFPEGQSATHTLRRNESAPCELFLERIELPIDHGLTGILVQDHQPFRPPPEAPILEHENAILERIAMGSALPLILADIAKLVERQMEETYCSILLLEGDRVRVMAAPSLPKEYNQCIDGAIIGPTAGSCGTAAYFGKKILTSDIETDPLWENYKHLALPHGLRACWSTPIILRNYGTVGTFAVYSKKPGLPDESFHSFLSRAERLVTVAFQNERNIRALRDSETRHRTFLDHSRDAVFLLDEQWRILDVNRQGCRSLGYSAEELKGRNFSHFEPALTLLERAERALQLSETNELDLETNFQNRSGNSFPVEIRVRAFQAEKGGRAVASVRDVSERHRLAEELRQSSKMEAVGRLAGGVAHDFNNILTVIQGYCSLLLMKPPATWTEDPIREIEAAAEQAASVTAQLLAFSRQDLVEPRCIDLNEAVGESLSLLGRLLGANVHLRTSVRAGNAVIKIDPTQLQQVIMNLAVNAGDAMPGGGDLFIETKDHPSGERVILRVSDTGKGLPPEQLENIFEPFFTTKEPGEGTGLGLAVVHGVISQAGGAIEVTSVPHQGTVFELSFPLHEGEVSRVARSPKELVRGTESVLCVEDEASVRLIVEKILGAAGYDVTVASRPSEALTLARKGSYHLLLTDLVMPEMNGRELAETLTREYPSLKVLYMTGYSDDTDLKDYLNQGIVELIHKPFSPSELTRAVRAALD